MREYTDLAVACADRDIAWAGGADLPLSYFGNELAGEAGEACNVVKKLERERYGMPGSRDTVEHLGEELADVVICAMNIANRSGLDLMAEVARKFNATSEKVGLPHRMKETARG